MRRKSILRWIAAVGLIVIAGLMLNLYSKIENWNRDLSINYASLDAASDDPRLHPPVFSQTQQQVAERIVAWAERTPRWAVESIATNGDSKIHLTRTTRIFRWVDDIHVQLIPVEDGVQVNADSKSRVGKGDLGQNPRNLRELVAGIRSEVNHE